MEKSKPECYTFYRKYNTVCDNCVCAEGCRESDERPSCYGTMLWDTLIRCQFCKYYYSCVIERDAY